MTNEILEHIIKLFVVFIIGVVLIGLGYSIEIIFLSVVGGLLVGIASLSILIGLILEVINSKN